MKKLLAAMALTGFLTLGAAAYSNDGAAPDQTQASDHHWGAFDQLPPADAQLIKDTLKKAHEDNKPLMAQEKKLHGDLRAVLTANAFDEKAFLAKEQKLQTVHDKIKTNMSVAFASALAQLSPDDRKIIADAMTAHHHWHHDHDKANWHGSNASAAPDATQSN